MDKRWRALIVEDSPIILENLCEMLEETGVVEIVGSAMDEEGACAWTDGHTQACDVAIVDVFLKSGNGLAVLRHMAAYAEPPDVVVFTNYATADVRKECARLGAAATFDKSNEIESLVEWLMARR